MLKIEFYLNKVIYFGLYAILLTPLVFWPKALYAFTTPKFILFQVFVEIVFTAWLVLAIYNPEYRPKISWLTIALAAFMAVSFLSSILGVDFSRSFWGIGARMTGLFTELHFLAWFIILITVFSNTNKNIRGIRMPLVNSYYYLNFSFAVSVLVALSAFYENSMWRMVYGSTFFNNPTFAAPYFLFHFFWGAYKIWKSRPFNKVFFGAGSILILIALSLGEIRGAILGLLAGILFLGIGLMFSDILSRKRKMTIAALCFLLLFGIATFWQWRNTRFVQSVNILKKFSEISTTITTAQTRILLWQISLKGFFDRPLFGAGPENFNYLFNAHYNPRFLKYGGGSFAETWQDKPHNAFLEVLSEIGVIGVVAYLAIWLAATFYLFKMFKNSLPAGRHGQKFLALVLSGAFISYLGAMFFSFDSFGSWFGLYLMLGFLASYSNKNDTNLYTDDTNKINKSVSKIFVSFACLLVLFVLLYVNYGIWRANIADADALRIFSRDPVQGIVLFKKSLSYKTPYKSEYQFDLIASIAGAVEKGLPLSNLEDTINFMLQESDKAVAAHPNDAAKYTDMVRIYNILGTKGRDPEILAQAEVFGKKSLELSPQRQETLYYLARTALLKNDAPSAVNFAKQAVLADPVIKQSHWYLGLAYIANSQIQEGITEIKKAIEMGYKPQNQSETNFIKSLGF